MENAERECCEQNWQECICSRLSGAFTINQDDYEDSQYDPTIDENKE